MRSLTRLHRARTLLPANVSRICSTESRYIRHRRYCSSMDKRFEENFDVNREGHRMYLRNDAREGAKSVDLKVLLDQDRSGRCQGTRPIESRRGHCYSARFAERRRNLETVYDRKPMIVCWRNRGCTDLFGVAVHAINNVPLSFSLFYAGHRGGWNFALASLLAVFIVLNGIVSCGAKRRRPQGRLHCRACLRTPHTIPQNLCFPSQTMSSVGN